MLHTDSLESLSLEGAWLTIGSFDGVHKGHQAILRRLVAGAHAQNAPAVALTFHPHPAVVLRHRTDPFYLTSPEQRARLLGEQGVDVVITHPFNQQVASRSARDFIRELKDHLGLRTLCVGPDFAMGHNREGNVAMLQRLGEEFDYSVSVIRPIRINREVVSSSRIRSAIRDGDVKTARQLLGRPYALDGAVAPGDGRGRRIGIPTANLDIWQEQLMPKAGVYACLARVGERMLRAVTNVGVRPTFNNPNAIAIPRAETHLLDYRGDLYGQRIELLFIDRLRDEQRFPDVASLIAQIQADIRRARRILRVKLSH
jgi:riboflavin kinase/FMN adenylyltransferase